MRTIVLIVAVCFISACSSPMKQIYVENAQRIVDCKTKGGIVFHAPLSNMYYGHCAFKD